MSTATGTPVFVSVGGDASAATATYTASGATTSTTVSLANIGQNAADALTSANTAAASAASAVTTANTASVNAASANKLASGAVQTSQANVASGYLQIGSDGCSAVLGKSGLAQNAGMTIGNQGANYQTFLSFYSGTSNNGEDFDSRYFAANGTGALDGDVGVWTSGAFRPWDSNKTALGTANNAWSGITSQTAVTVISDKNDKDIVGTIGAQDYADVTTKLRAVWQNISGVVYTLKYGHSGRKHIGVIAQNIETAFKAQGLNPADYGVWCETELTETVKKTETVTIDGKEESVERYVTQPLLDGTGARVKKQSVRYDELYALGLFCERLDYAELKARVSELEAKLSATPATA